MRGFNSDVSKQIDNIITRSKNDLEEVDAIVRKVKKDAFAEYRRQFRQTNVNTDKK